MSARKPYTMRERRQFSQTFKSRPVNDWGDGDLPAPFAQGDVVALVGEGIADGRGFGLPLRSHYVVSYACSIDEGDAWYFRVGAYDDNGWACISDRLHVAYADRCTWDQDVNYMEPFQLADTVDPDGLALRTRILTEGWTFESRWAKCPTCGNTTRVES